MNNNKGDLYHLKKMTADIDFIIKHTAGMSMDELHKDEVLLDSMMFRLIQISESVKNLSTQFKQMHSDIAWTDISGLRNRIVHDYGNVDLMVVFDTVSSDIPQLKEALGRCM